MNRVTEIQEKIYEQYNRYIDDMLTRSPKYLLDHAEEIAFVKQTADLLHDDAEELPDALVYHLRHTDTFFSELYAMWKDAEPNRREDERETLRELFMTANHRFAETYPAEEMDEDMEL